MRRLLVVGHRVVYDIGWTSNLKGANPCVLMIVDW